MNVKERKKERKKERVDEWFINDRVQEDWYRGFISSHLRKQREKEGGNKASSSLE